MTDRSHRALVNWTDINFSASWFPDLSIKSSSTRNISSTLPPLLTHYSMEKSINNILTNRHFSKSLFLFSEKEKLPAFSILVAINNENL